MIDQQHKGFISHFLQTSSIPSSIPPFPPALKQPSLNNPTREPSPSCTKPKPTTYSQPNLPRKTRPNQPETQSSFLTKLCLRTPHHCPKNNQSPLAASFPLFSSNPTMYTTLLNHQNSHKPQPPPPALTTISANPISTVNLLQAQQSSTSLSTTTAKSPF